MKTALLIILFFIGLTAAYASMSAAPWLPSKKRERRLLKESLPIIKGQTVCDLGCGDGRVLFDLVKAHPEAQFIGYELFLIPYAIAKARSLFYPNVRILWADFFRTNIGDADIVFAFLQAKSYARLIEKFTHELKPDAQIVIEAWPFENIAPEHTATSAGTLPLYFYRVETLQSLTPKA